MRGKTGVARRRIGGKSEGNSAIDTDDFVIPGA